MTKSILLSALGAGMLATLPLHAQEAPAPAPTPAAPQAAAPAKSLTAAEQAAIESFMNKASAASFRAMAEMTPEEMQSLATSKTSKAAILLSKKMLSIPLDSNLPSFWKENTEKSKALTEEMIKAVESNAPAEKVNELIEKLETMTKDSSKELAANGVNMEEISQKMQKKIQMLMGEISKTIVTSNPEAAKDPSAMMKLMFTELANKLESEPAK